MHCQDAALNAGVGPPAFSAEMAAFTRIAMNLAVQSGCDLFSVALRFFECFFFIARDLLFVYPFRCYLCPEYFFMIKRCKCFIL